MHSCNVASQCTEPCILLVYPGVTHSGDHIISLLRRYVTILCVSYIHAFYASQSLAIYTSTVTVIEHSKAYFKCVLDLSPNTYFYCRIASIWFNKFSVFVHKLYCHLCTKYINTNWINSINISKYLRR